MLGKIVFFLLEEIKIFSSNLLSSLCLVYSCMWKRKVFPTQYASALLCEFKCTSLNHVLLSFYFPPFWFSSVRRDGVPQEELRWKSIQMYTKMIRQTVYKYSDNLGRLYPEIFLWERWYSFVSRYCLTIVCLMCRLPAFLALKTFLYNKVFMIVSLIFSMHSKCAWSFEMMEESTTQV